MIYFYSFSRTQVGIDLFGLIRLKLRYVYDIFNILIIVGIDLFGLIRLKHGGMGSSLWEEVEVGIDLFGLIRLKLISEVDSFAEFLRSGLICLD